VVDELLERGHVRRPFIGIAVQPVALSAALTKQHQISGDRGLLIVSIADNSPAEQGGVLIGDVLLEAGGRRLSRPDDLLDALSETAQAAAVNLNVLRGGAMKTLSITPGDRGERE
jgi:S1-C subfamily serine protease